MSRAGLSWVVPAIMFGVIFCLGLGSSTAQASEGASGRSPASLERLMTAAEAGEPAALAAVGEYQQFGWGGLSPDEAAALDWYRRAAAAGNARGALRLGLFYNGGLGGLTRNQAEARRWFSQAAEGGEPWAMQHLASYYQQGLGGLPQDRSRALHWRRQAAEGGVGEAMRALGSAYEIGEGGLSIDLAVALDWYRRAQAAGDPRAGVEVERLERLARLSELVCLAYIDDGLADLRAEQAVLDALPALPRFASAEARARLDGVGRDIAAEMRALESAREPFAGLGQITDLDRYHIRQRPSETGTVIAARCLSPTGS